MSMILIEGSVPRITKSVKLPTDLLGIFKLPGYFLSARIFFRSARIFFETPGIFETARNFFNFQMPPGIPGEIARKKNTAF